MAKLAKLEKIRKALKSFNDKVADREQLKKLDWNFAPAINEKGNPGHNYSRASMNFDDIGNLTYNPDYDRNYAIANLFAPEEQGQMAAAAMGLNPNSFYKTQFISPEGDIIRQSVGVPGNSEYFYTFNSKRHPYQHGTYYEDSARQDVHPYRTDRFSKGKAAWGQDFDGNWYNLNAEEVMVPKSAAAEMKRNTKRHGTLFEDVNMLKLPKNAEVEAGDFEKSRMKREARFSRSYRGSDPYGPFGDRGNNTNFMHNAKTKVANHQEAAAKEAHEAMKENSRQAMKELERQIEELKARKQAMEQEFYKNYDLPEESRSKYREELLYR